MTNEEIRSVKLCLMAHPDNEPDSEFSDRISDMEELEEKLSSTPTPQEASGTVGNTGGSLFMKETFGLILQ